MVRYATQWLSPEPLWNELAGGSTNTEFRRPALLRFASDTFMSDLQASLKSGGLRDLIAAPETWQAPAAGMDAREKAAGAGLKLFHPVHQRFYLIACSLTCRKPGLPDHTVDTAAKEKTSFVLRRYDPVAGTEWAWTGNWQVADAGTVFEGEERLPLFPVLYDAALGKRRMLAGMVPTGRRQQYAGGKDATQAPPPTPIDALMLDFERTIGLPWLAAIKAESDAEAAGKNTVKAQMPIETAFMLLDFAEFLSSNFPQVWAKIENTSAVVTGKQKALYELLYTTTYTGGARIADSLKSALAQQSTLNGLLLESDLPAEFQNYDFTDTAVATLIKDDTFTESSAIEDAIRAAAAEVTLSPAPAGLRQPATSPVGADGSDWYLIHCLYERPECGLKAPVIFSAPSEPFQIASFFDPDAPARQIQVALPFDTSPATLRKYDKNVAFMISDQLQKQMSRVKSAQDLVSGTVGSPDGLTIGFICSLSIPIITIVAFMLLIVFVIVLNIVFFWLPFFKICFPIPKKA